MTMPFGKYKFRDLEDLPSDYLSWLSTIDLRPALETAVLDEMDRRRKRETRNKKPTRSSSSAAVIEVPPDKLLLARRVFDSGYHSVAQKLHPDTGGEKEQMQELNALAAIFRK